MEEIIDESHTGDTEINWKLEKILKDNAFVIESVKRDLISKLRALEGIGYYSGVTNRKINIGVSLHPELQEENQVYLNLLKAHRLLAKSETTLKKYEIFPK
jgi:hypothetical protein